MKTSEDGYTAKVTNYLYDRQHVILETDAKGQIIVRYVRGLNYIARIDGTGKRSYYLYNGHGDVVQTAAQDGTVENQYDYDIFGNPILTIEQYSNAIRYAGEFYDTETGLYYLRARYYNPYTGRFISEDSYWGEDTNPLSLNLYTYCENDPINFIDPSGHKRKNTTGLSDAQLEKTLETYKELVDKGVITQEMADKGIENMYNNDSGTTIGDDGVVHVSKDDSYNKTYERKKELYDIRDDYAEGKISEEEMRDRVQSTLDINPAPQVELTPLQELEQINSNIDSATHAYEGGYISEEDYWGNVGQNVDTLLKVLLNSGNGSTGIGGETDADNERIRAALERYHKGQITIDELNKMVGKGNLLVSAGTSDVGFSLMTGNELPMTVEEAVFGENQQLINIIIDSMVEVTSNDGVEFTTISPIVQDAVNDIRKDIDSIMKNTTYRSILGEGLIYNKSWGHEYTRRYNREVFEFNQLDSFGVTIDVATGIVQGKGSMHSNITIDTIANGLNGRYGGAGPSELLPLQSQLKAVIEAKAKKDFVDDSSYKYLIYNSSARKKFIKELNNLKDIVKSQHISGKYDDEEDVNTYKKSMIGYIQGIIDLNTNYNESKEDLDVFIERIY